MVPHGTQYRCWSHNLLSAPPHCESDLVIRIDHLDGLLWSVASAEEIKYRMRMDASKKEEYEGRIKEFRDEVENTRKKLLASERKQDRIKELYIDGEISKEEFKKRQNKTLSDIKWYNDTILQYEEKIEGFLRLIEGGNEEMTLDRLKTLYVGVAKEEDLVMMEDIVKRQIERVTFERCEFHDVRTAKMITIYTMYSGVRKFIYVARKWKGHYFFNEKGESLPGIRPIVRTPGKLSPRSFKKIADWD